MRHDRNQARPLRQSFQQLNTQGQVSIRSSYSAMGQTTRELIAAVLLFLVAAGPVVAIMLWRSV